jgi:hypothetical protein
MRKAEQGTSARVAEGVGVLAQQRSRLLNPRRAAALLAAWSLGVAGNFR